MSLPSTVLLDITPVPTENDQEGDTKRTRSIDLDLPDVCDLNPMGITKQEAENTPEVVFKSDPHEVIIKTDPEDKTKVFPKTDSRKRETSDKQSASKKMK